MNTTFTTTVWKEDGGNATGLHVPEETVAGLGHGKKPPVRVTINGYTYRSSIFPRGGVFMLPLSAEHRQGAGVQAGDQVLVTLELDTQPRTVEIPEDLTTALSQQPGARAGFNALAYTLRKEYVRQVETAKAQETRERRIASIVAKLGAP